MGLEFVSAFCPKCGGNIQIPSGTDRCYCTYCGTQILLDDGSEKVTFRTIDEARIKEADVNATLELKRLEMESESRRTRLGILKVAAIISGCLLALGLVVGYFVESYVGYTLGMLAVVLLMWTSIFTLLTPQDRTKGDEAGQSGHVDADAEAYRTDSIEYARKHRNRGLSTGVAGALAVSALYALMGRRR